MSYGLQAPMYADLGLKVVPLGGDDRRRPLINGFFRHPPGPEAVRKLAKRFPDANIGLLMGPSGLVAVDIDDRSDVSRAIEIFGDSPVKVVTSRGEHLFFRATGREKSHNLRRIGLQIDVKAGNALVVAPWSRHPSGHIYQYLDGGAEDLEPHNDLLPVFATDALQQLLETVNGTQGPIKEGDRGMALFNHLRAFASQTDVNEKTSLWLEGRSWADRNTDPIMTNSDVQRQVDGVWRLVEQGRCFAPGIEAHLIIPRSRLDIFGGNADAYLLFSKLKMIWGDRSARFPLSDYAMARDGTIPGWGRDRYRSAIRFLVDNGLVIFGRKGRGRGMPSLYRWSVSANPTLSNIRPRPINDLQDSTTLGP